MCKTIKLDSNKLAIVCNHGKSSDHECNEDLSVLLLSDGSRVEGSSENQKKYYKEVRGGSVACSICGRAAIDNAPYL